MIQVLDLEAKEDEVNVLDYSNVEAFKIPTVRGDGDDDGRLDSIDIDDSRETNTAATRLQAIQRGKLAKKELDQLRQEQEQAQEQEQEQEQETDGNSDTRGTSVPASVPASVPVSVPVSVPASVLATETATDAVKEIEIEKEIEKEIETVTTGDGSSGGGEGELSKQKDAESGTDSNSNPSTSSTIAQALKDEIAEEKALTLQIVVASAASHSNDLSVRHQKEEKEETSLEKALENVLKGDGTDVDQLEDAIQVIL